MTTPTNPSVTHDLRLAARQGLLPSYGSGRLAGFANMLGKELGEWFGTRRWLWQSVIWLSIINGFIAFILFIVPIIDPAEGQVEGAPPPDLMGLTLFFAFAVMAGSIGMIIQAQDEVIQEKQSGTAAWILSKPVARQSFILTKLLSNIIGGLIFIVALPALVALGEIYLAVGHSTPLLPFLAGAAVILLTLIFYLSLVILLGVVFEQRGPVLGVAFGVMFGGLIAAQFAPQVSYFLPLTMDKIALAVSQSQPLPGMAISQLVATAAWSILFTVVALWRFQRTEF
jgi:ABC-2 type transport system permease protein